VTDLFAGNGWLKQEIWEILCRFKCQKSPGIAGPEVMASTLSGFRDRGVGVEGGLNGIDELGGSEL
jgi:hypothetical protein